MNFSLLEKYTLKGRTYRISGILSAPPPPPPFIYVNQGHIVNTTAAQLFHNQAQHCVRARACVCAGGVCKSQRHGILLYIPQPKQEMQKNPKNPLLHYIKRNTRYGFTFNKVFFLFFYAFFCPGTMTAHAESINSDLQRGLDRRLLHTQKWTQNRTSKPLKYQRTINTTATLVVKY